MREMSPLHTFGGKAVSASADCERFRKVRLVGRRELPERKEPWQQVPELLYQREGAIATLTLNRPERRNAFTSVMIREWAEALAEATLDDQVRAIVLTGNGSGFCAGGDLEEIGSWRSQDPIARKNGLWKEIHRIAIAMAALDNPVIAAVNGAAAGAGCDMALMCDIRVASEKATFAETYLLAGQRRTECSNPDRRHGGRPGQGALPAFLSPGRLRPAPGRDPGQAYKRPTRRVWLCEHTLTGRTLHRGENAWRYRGTRWQ